MDPQELGDEKVQFTIPTKEELQQIYKIMDEYGDDYELNSLKEDEFLLMMKVAVVPDKSRLIKEYYEVNGGTPPESIIHSKK